MVHMALKYFFGQTVWHMAGQNWFQLFRLTIILQYEVVDISASALVSDSQSKFWCFVLASGPGPGADIFICCRCISCVFMWLSFKKKKGKRVCSKQFLIWKKKAFPPVTFKRQFPALRDHDNTYAVWYIIIQRKRGRTKLFCFIVTKYLRVSLSTWQLKVNLLLKMDSCPFDDRNPLLWVAQHFSSLMLGFRWSCKSFWIFICVIVLV